MKLFKIFDFDQISNLFFVKSKNFEYLGPLTLVPYCMDHEGQQVLSFMCLSTIPNCIVILLTSGIIYHCLFMPNTKYTLFESGNVNYVLYIIIIDRSMDLKKIKLILLFLR